MLRPTAAASLAGTALASRWEPTSVTGIELPQGIGAECALAATVPLPNGLDLLFMAVKPTWRLDSEVVRTTQAQAIAQFDAKLRQTVPTIIAGDFDATPDADCMRYLTGKTVVENTSVHYHDAWTIGGDGGPGYTWTSDNTLAEPLIRNTLGQLRHARRIDYILVGSFHNHPLAAARVLDSRVVMTDPPASDHYGVLADIEIEAR